MFSQMLVLIGLGNISFRPLFCVLVKRDLRKKTIFLKTSCRFEAHCKNCHLAQHYYLSKKKEKNIFIILVKKAVTTFL